MRTLFAALALASATFSAQAVQVVLTPASVIGSSGALSSNFAADNILDQQIGAVADTSRSTYWLNPDNSGAATVYITIDLGAAYRIDELVLFNTHNDTWFDRGTGAFTILGGNAITTDGAGNFRVTGSTSTIVSGSLGAVSTTVPPAQSFLVADTGTYRYLSFQPTSVAAFQTAPSSTAYGLNELRVFASAVPEPSQWAMFGVGLLAVGGVVKRRRQR